MFDGDGKTEKITRGGFTCKIDAMAKWLMEFVSKLQSGEIRKGGRIHVVLDSSPGTKTKAFGDPKHRSQDAVCQIEAEGKLLQW